MNIRHKRTERIFKCINQGDLKSYTYALKKVLKLFHLSN